MKKNRNGKALRTVVRGVSARPAASGVSRRGRPTPDRDTAVSRIARLLGSYAELARVCGISRSRVAHWENDREKGGRDGAIPDVYHAKILAAFLERGVRFDKAELLNV